MSRVVRATVLLTAFSLLSRLMGLGRETAIAYSFGATKATDAFLVAFIIPYMFYAVVEMALATVIVPVFAAYEAEGRRDEAWRVMSLVTNAVLVIVLALALLGVFCSPLLASLLGAGFPPETLRLAGELTAIVMPSVVFLSLAGIFAGLLNAHNIFGPPAFGPAAMDLVIIIAALVGAKFYGIYGLAAGAAGGALAFALVQLPALKRLGFRYYFLLDFKHPEVKRVGGMILPVVIASGITSIYTMIDLRFASGLQEGSIAALNYASKLMNLPQGLFVLSVTTALFPTLSALAAAKRLPELANTLQKGLQAVILLAVPGAIGLAVLREPIVTLLFERGAFDGQATALTAEALLFYTLGLAALCCNYLLTRGFFALQDTKTPLLVSLASVLVKIVFSLALVGPLAHAGLALATSLAGLFSAVMLYCLLQKTLQGLFTASCRCFCLEVLGASAVMGIVVYFLDYFLMIRLPPGSLYLALRIGLDLIVGALIIFTKKGTISFLRSLSTNKDLKKCA